MGIPIMIIMDHDTSPTKYTTSNEHQPTGFGKLLTWWLPTMNGIQPTCLADVFFKRALVNLHPLPNGGLHMFSSSYISLADIFEMESYQSSRKILCWAVFWGMFGTSPKTSLMSGTWGKPVVWETHPTHPIPKFEHTYPIHGSWCVMSSNLLQKRWVFSRCFFKGGVVPSSRRGQGHSEALDFSIAGPQPKCYGLGCALCPSSSWFWLEVATEGWSMLEPLPWSCWFFGVKHSIKKRP